MTEAEGIRELAALIREADSVVALTGAGISVPSGIPDFRSPRTGLWANVDPLEVAQIDVFRREPERFWRFYASRVQSLEDKRPNGAHLALAALERAGRLHAVVTQNIDRLHAVAGTTSLVEVHGTIAHSSCLVCRTEVALADVRDRQRAAADAVPRCECGRPLKPDVVLFGEYLPADAFLRAEQLAAGADVLLCIGSSLAVYPVAQLPDVTLAQGGRLAVLTQGPTPFDHRADIRLRGDVIAVMDALLDELGVARETAATA